MARTPETESQADSGTTNTNWRWPNIPSVRDDFLHDLEQFHVQRGTPLDKEPKVSNRHIDLWRLFQIVEERGGYDTVSAEKLAWRKLAQEFGLHQPAYAFQVKTIFYKFLAAYAIKKVYNQEPPPREILEDLTARGGDLLTRSLDNYEPPNRGATQDVLPDGSGEDTQDGQKMEKMDIEDHSASSRSGRSLRQAPAPRQIFTPDVSSSRQNRNVSATSTSTSSQAGLALSNGTVAQGTNRFDPITYEGAVAPPQSLKTVAVPLHLPLVFRNRNKQIREQHRSAQRGAIPVPKGVFLPGTGSVGHLDTAIYIRVLNSLRSPILDDQRWAVHHLVKISDVQGHRFRLDAFGGMSEGLVEIVLGVASLYYDVRWRISYEEHPSSDTEVLDGLRGTPDLPARIGRLQIRDDSKGLRGGEVAADLMLYNEAALALRNLALQEINAWHLASLLPVKDVLCILLWLPDRPELSEMKHFALDIAEMVVKYLPLSSSDPLYLGILSFAKKGQDRGAILTALRAICRIAAHASDANLLPEVDTELLRNLHAWTHLEDDELVQATLEYFYQYTGVTRNVSMILDSSSNFDFPLHAFVEHLARLMKHNAKEDVVRREVAAAIPGHKPAERASLPEALLNELLKMEEPARASRWLKCMFEEDPKADVTQLELWQSYQNTFGTKIEDTGSAALMTAADFIKNVSNTLSGATARIVKPQNGGNNPRFIMSGIRYRDRPTDPEGRKFSKCVWKEADASDPCGSYHEPGPPMFDHILTTHLNLPDARKLEAMSTDEAAKIRTTGRECLWNSCRHFARCRSGHEPSAVELTRHVNLHMSSAKRSNVNGKMDPRKRQKNSIAPNDPNKAYRHRDKPEDESLGYPAIHDYNAFYDTGTDERNNANGIAYWACMVLRNLARNIPKAVAAADEESTVSKEARTTRGEEKTITSAVWMQKLFLPIRRHIFHVLAYNRPLAFWIFDLLIHMDKGIQDKNARG